MKIDCSNDILSAGDKRKQNELLLEYSKLIDRSTDVAIPFYKIDADNFERIWPPTNITHPFYMNEECSFWRRIMGMVREYSIIRRHEKDDYSQYIIKNNTDDPCSGELNSVCLVAFVNDHKYTTLSGIDFIKSPGIYIKDPLRIDKYLFDFIVSYNMHLAETYYLFNRKAIIETPNSTEMDFFKSFIISFLTLRSFFKKNEKMAKDLIHNQFSSLVGSWKRPFEILNNVPQREWKDIFNHDEIISSIEDILSGLPIENVSSRLVRIYTELEY